MVCSQVGLARQMVKASLSPLALLLQAASTGVGANTTTAAPRNAAADFSSPALGAVLGALLALAALL
jgi:hypothetical protein